MRKRIISSIFVIIIIISFGMVAKNQVIGGLMPQKMSQQVANAGKMINLALDVQFAKRSKLLVDKAKMKCLKGISSKVTISKKSMGIDMYIDFASKVSLRKNPNLKSGIKKSLKNGTKVELLLRKGKWCKVREKKSGNIGYVYNTYLRSTKEKRLYFNGVELKYFARYNICQEPLNERDGVKKYNGHHETYYSQKVLPGGGLKIPGRHVAEDGTIRDQDGYICVSAHLNYLSRGATLMTSLGPAKVYDTGCAYGTIDVYVIW